MINLECERKDELNFTQRIILLFELSKINLIFLDLKSNNLLWHYKSARIATSIVNFIACSNLAIFYVNIVILKKLGY